MELIYQAVKNIIIFLLLVTVLSNLIGHSSYKKYIDIFVGLVLILIVVTPFLKLINSADKVDHYYNQNVYKFNASDMSEQLLNADEDYQKTILKEYQKTIEKQINDELSAYDLETTKVTTTINEDVESEECGSVLTINVTATAKKEDETDDNTLEIDPVDEVVIDKVDINKAEDALEEADTSEADQYDTVQELTIKEELAALYGISEDHIKVTISS